MNQNIKMWLWLITTTIILLLLDVTMLLLDIHNAILIGVSAILGWLIVMREEKS